MALDNKIKQARSFFRSRIVFIKKFCKNDLNSSSQLIEYIDRNINQIQNVFEKLNDEQGKLSLIDKLNDIKIEVKNRTNK
jgi:hypothetical protein